MSWADKQLKKHKQVMSDTESRNNYCGECGCKFDWSEIDETD